MLTNAYNLCLYNHVAGKEQLKSVKFDVALQQWYTLVVIVKVRIHCTLYSDPLYLLSINDTQHKYVSVEVIKPNGGGVFDSAETKTNRPGFIAMGTGGYYAAQFDNFYIMDSL